MRCGGLKRGLWEEAVQDSSSRPDGAASAGPGRGLGQADFPAGCGIAVMAKASAAGRTKTRLVPPLTYEEAASFNTAFLKDVAQNILAAAHPRSIAGYMAFGPPRTGAFFQDNICPEIGLFEVWLPNFGDCLHWAIRELLERGHAGAIVLNSDSPTLPTGLLIEAVDLLAQPGDRAVLGPAEDGGYYLLGLKKAHRRMFDNIEWSTSRVADQTIDRAQEIGLRMHVLSPWYDVDDAAALRMLHGELADGRSFHPALRPYHAAHTAELMKSLCQRAALAERLGVKVMEGAGS